MKQVPLRFRLAAVGIALLVLGSVACHREQPARAKGTQDAVAALLVEGRAAGTAFVVERIASSAWLATDVRAVPAGAKVEVRFAPDGVLAAEIAFRDEGEGLAILRVEGAGLREPLRTPISVSRETETKALLVSASRPPLPVTVFRARPVLASKGAKDDDTALLRLSGALEPSLTGSPVVSTEGRLIGVASIASATSATLVPAATLVSILGGRVARFEVRELSTAPGSATLEVEVQLLDPSAKVERAHFQLRSRTDQPTRPVPTPGQEIDFVAGAFAASADISLNEGRGRALVRVQRAPTDAEFWAELYFRSAGKEKGYVFAPPLETTIHFSGDPSRAANGGPGANEIEVPLPSRATALLPASSGKLVLLSLEGSDTLKVWEPAARRFVREIRLPSSNFLLAAGGETALVYFPENALLSAYDLATGEKRLSATNPLPRPIVALLMGAGNGEKAIARTRPDNPGSELLSYLVDIPTLAPLPNPQTPLRFGSARCSFYPCRHLADPFLTKTTEWAVGVSPSGVGVYTIEGTSVQHTYVHDGDGWLSPSEDGRIYTRTGEVRGSKLGVEAKIPGRKLLAGLGGVFFLGIGGDDSLELFVSGTTTGAAHLGRHPGRPSETTTLLLGSEGKLVLLGKESRSLVQRDFDTAAALTATR